MPTINANKKVWNDSWDWSQRGDEWSSHWGGTDMEWYGTILPRVQSFLPTSTVLEIGPGFGRWTQYLAPLCEELIIVDLAPKCIEFCKTRFAEFSHIRYLVNDGTSLDMVPDGSVDFVFTFDSLVHAEIDVINGYLEQLTSKFKEGGTGFIHHSNLGAYAGYYALTRKVRWSGLRNALARLRLIQNSGWRGNSVTADEFRAQAKRCGLTCPSQELINWFGTLLLIDCFSVIVKEKHSGRGETRVLRNRAFVNGVRKLSEIAQIYGTNPIEPINSNEEKPAR